MICGACGRDNRYWARFCTQCGVALHAACPACRALTEPGEKFCAECGSALAAGISDRLSTPRTLGISGEKKHITVLFADVAGSMDLQERLDAEVWAQIMGRFVGILAEGVRKFGGTVDKFTGDGIMALFGAPVAQEDHARRACHAAWHLTKAIGEYAEELRREQDVELHVRLGLNSGEVVVGRVGDDVTLDPTALGHTVGLAQRMEAMAEPGTAYLAEHTARLVEGWFSLRDLGAKPVKGSREQLRVYSLAGPAPSLPVLRGAGLGIVPLVGRERELAVLEDALAMAEEGQAQVVGVVGEAGVGKSRLCEEFAASAAARGISVRRSAGLSHGRDVPLLAMLAFQRDYFGITDADTAEDARAKVARRVLGLDPALDDALPLLFDFLEVADPERPPPQLTAEIRMRRVFETIRRLTLKRSERETLVLIFEDLHYFDPHSEAFLERLIESFPGSRTLVVANFRPEFSASWMRHSYYRQLLLVPLRDEAVSQLLRRLLGPDPSLAPLVSCVTQRTGGNPFFVEELVRAFVADGTVTGRPGNYRLDRPVCESVLPPTVQAVLAARIDRLPTTQKSMLQTAAVVGRDFSAAVLARVMDVPQEALDDDLAAASRAELLQHVGTSSQPEYRFWHPLTHEVAYSTLLAERRRELHAAAARAIAEVGPERADERAALVAAHFERAGDALETARWNVKAATWALRTDLSEAVRRWRATIDLLDKVAPTDDVLRLAVLARTKLLQLGARTRIEPDEAGRLYAEGATLAQRLQHPGLLAMITRYSASILLVAGEFQAARDRYHEAARLEVDPDDRDLQASLWFGPSFVSIYSGTVAQGLDAADRVRTVCEGDADLGTLYVGYSPLVRSRAYRAELLALGGRLDDATAEVNEVLPLARSRSDVEGVAWTLTTLVRISDRRGTLGNEAVGWATEALRLTDETGNVLFRLIGRTALATAYVGIGRLDEAIRILNENLCGMRARHNPRHEEANALIVLARVQLELGDHEAARACAGKAVEVARRQDGKVPECLAVLTRARAQRQMAAPHGACDRDLSAALTLVTETGASTYQPFIVEERGRLHDDDDELRRALALYRQIGATEHVQRLEAELSGNTVR